MKRFLLLLPALAVLLTVNSCRKAAFQKNTSAVPVPHHAGLDAFIQEKVWETGAFEWSWATDEMIWTALGNSDHVLSVGYQPEGEQNVPERLHQINIKDAAWQDARQQVLELILSAEQRLNPELTQEQLFAFAENDVLPVFNVRVYNPETIALLRASKYLRYAEPTGYEPFKKESTARSGSGCDSNYGEPGLALGPDYSNEQPGCKASWNHPYQKIKDAWAQSDGSGATLLVIDTGCSDEQENLGEDLNQGFSSGRSIEKYVTLPQQTNFWGNPVGDPETPNDLCGHGTSMLGAAAAPRGTDGNSVGIAYNANLISIRAAADVYLDESREVVGVSNAFTFAGQNGAVRVISMSMGRITSSSQIRDAIIYAHNNGKMIFAAAGTSYSWTAWFAGVIFPANQTQCIAVTGIRDNLTQKCGACHVGSKVDFVLVMEKAGNGRTALSLAQSGDVPSTVGGSSVATASTAGIATLVFSKYPGWTRQQVFDRMKTSANYYPSRNSNFGWGRVDAKKATL